MRRLWPHARRLRTPCAIANYSIGGGSVGIAVYDDRLEVTSSGSLHFGLTPEKLFAPHESRPWNPLIGPHLLPSRHHRGVGQRNAEDGRLGKQLGASSPGDRG